MRYYRLTFKSVDREGGSTYSKPRFTINLPSNQFDASRMRDCKVVLEQFSGYAGSKTTSKTTPVEQICVSFLHQSGSNAIQTSGTGRYENSKGLGFVNATNLTDITKTFAFYAKEKHPGEAEKEGIIMPCSTFANNIVEFDLHYINGTAIVEPDTAYRYYVMCLGVYVEEDGDEK